MPFAHNLADNAVFFARKWRGKGPRPPLRTIQEMAEELGLTMAQLRAFMAHSKHNPPAPAIKHRPASTPCKTYYDPGQVREWWARHNQKTPKEPDEA